MGKLSTPKRYGSDPAKGSTSTVLYAGLSSRQECSNVHSCCPTPYHWEQVLQPGLALDQFGDTKSLECLIDLLVTVWTPKWISRVAGFHSYSMKLQTGETTSILVYLV